VNRTILIGNLTRDPEQRETKADYTVASFSIAVNRRGKNERTDFFNCTAFRHTADNLLQYKKKGDPIAVEGHLETFTKEDDESGKKYTRTTVIADNVEFLGRGKNNEGEGDSDAASDDIPF
jgi:single-strand DNA-binding protein